MRNQRSSAVWQHLPEAFPQSEFEFDAWRVFADQLQSAGERLGELMALDLSLPRDVSREVLEGLLQRAAKPCRQYTFFEIGWCLGLVRTVYVHPRTPLKMSSPRLDQIDQQAGAALGELLRHPRAARIESLSLPLSQQALADKQVRRVLGSLSPTCRVVEFRAIEATLVHEACALLPETVTRVRLTRDLPVPSGRFEWDLRPAFGAEVPLAQGRVILGSGRWARPPAQPLGDRGDAALIGEVEITLLERSSLRELQRIRGGYISVAGQVHRTPDERPDYDSPLRRHGDGRWTVRDGGVIRTLAAGEAVVIEGVSWRFHPESRDVPWT